MFPAFRDKPIYKPLIWMSAVIIFILIIWFGMRFISNNSLAFGPDFIEYWSAGRVNLNQGNPYDPNHLHRYQIQTGFIEEGAIMMWNPPWILAIAMLLGSLDYQSSRLLWFLVNTFAIFVCINLVWDLYGGMKKFRWIALIIGYSFAPVLIGLKIGQTGALLLFGLVGFLVLIVRGRFFLAGVFLSLVAVKPHILYLIFIAVLFWSIYRKQWKIIIGFITILTIATAISWIINPNVIQQYLTAIQRYPPVDWAAPTIGAVFRLIFGTEIFFLQFIPTILGFVWMIYYWINHRENWDWLEQLPLLVLVSTLTTAYGWIWDLTVCLIPILQVFALIILMKGERSAFLAITTYILIAGLALSISGNYFWSFWLAPTLLIWYLASKRILRIPELPVESNSID